MSTPALVKAQLIEMKEDLKAELPLADVKAGGWFGKVVKRKLQGTSNVGPVTGGEGRPAEPLGVERMGEAEVAPAVGATLLMVMVVSALTSFCPSLTVRRTTPLPGKRYARRLAVDAQGRLRAHFPFGTQPPAIAASTIRSGPPGDDASSRIATPLP